MLFAELEIWDVSWKSIVKVLLTVGVYRFDGILLGLEQVCGNDEGCA